MERIQRALELARLQRAAGPGPDAIRVSRETAPPESWRPRIVRVDRAALAERRIVLPEDRSPASHAYRMLRSQILQRARQHALQTVGIVSAVDGEGKTLTAVNVALALAAEPNQSVTLVDLDLRCPSIAGLLGLSIAQGVDDWLAGRAERNDLLHAIEGIERLTIVPTRAPVPGSSEALAGARARALLGELKKREPQGLLVLDLPPVLLSDDFLTAAPLLDGVLVVVSEGHTRREDLARVRELLGSVRQLGTVLNRSRESEQRAY